MKEFEFDQALSDFLDDEQCERISEAIYQMMKECFAAGWRAANQARGSAPPTTPGDGT